MIANIQGIFFHQESLASDLANKIAGQRIETKIILILLISLLCFIIGIFAGYIGGITSLQVGVGKKAQLEYLSMLLVVVTWISSVFFQSLSRSLVTVIFSFFIVEAFLILLVRLDIVKLQPFFFIRSTVIILFFLAITIISFFVFRFTVALTDVLLDNFQIFKSLSIFIISFGAIAGSLIAIAGEVQSPVSEFREMSISTKLKIAIIFSGILYAICLALSGWLANRIRGVPWKYPDLLRSLVLTVGSWGGTSFYDLDLSNVNFRNAKLPNTDLRARKLYRTCFQGVTGLKRARVDNRYLDLDNPKVQKLLTHAYSEDKEFSGINLQGAYLQGADLRDFKLIETNLNGADLRDADLRGSILVRAQVIGVDFTGANLTGICIEDWSVNSQTCFTNVQCDYVYRKLGENGKPTDLFPIERHFEFREFESLYQEVGNVVELIFKEGVNWRAFSFALQKLQIDDEGLGLELKGIEKRGDLWVVKVTHNQNISSQVVEQHFNAAYEAIQKQLTAKEQQINQLLGIVADQAEALKEHSHQPFGNSFFIMGSTITNLAGSGQIDYNEALSSIRSLVANGTDPTQVTSVIQNLLEQFQRQSVATTVEQQAELIQQVILTEARKDPFFKQVFIQQGQQIAHTLPKGAIATAIQSAIAQLTK